MSQDKTQLAARGAKKAGPLCLLVVGEEMIATHPLPDIGQLRIGRAADCDVPIEAPKVSRSHAVLHVREDGLRLEDLGSTNGTKVRDTWVGSGETVMVAPGDVIEIGSTIILVQRSTIGATPRALAKHGYFEARVAEECARAARSGTTLAVARIALPERAQAAPEVLTKVLLARCDVVARYGPDELELLVVDGAAAQASDWQRGLVEALAALGLEVRVGLALYPRDGRDADALIASAAPPQAAATKLAVASVRPVDEPRWVVGDPTMQSLYRVIDRLAAGHIAVLVLGETGVGKELIAERIHESSPRRGKPFLRLNCAALTETLAESELFGHAKGAFTGAVQHKQGLLASADGGTVFLDEVGELPLPLQAKLLRVIEDAQVLPVGGLKARTIDVRFVAATNRDLRAESDAGRFRRDLFYRLNGATLFVPPLRERPVEVAMMANRFIATACRRIGQPAVGLSAPALAWMQRYAWPGNVRELKNLIERAVLLSGGAPIALEHLPLERMDDLGAHLSTPAWGRAGLAAVPAVVPAAVPAAGPVLVVVGGGGVGDDVEHARVLDALARCNGNQTRAARVLGIARSTLVRRLDDFGVPRPRKA